MTPIYLTEKDFRHLFGKKRPTKSPKKSIKKDYETGFLFYLKALAPGLEAPEREYKFHDWRRWRFDLAWPDHKIAVEIDGGQWSPNGGRHNRDSDREKINEAVKMGWRVFRFSTQQVKNDPHDCIKKLKEVFVI